MPPELRYPSPAVARSLKGFARAVSKVLWRIEYVGLDNIPAEGDTGYVVAANHQTYVDPVWIAAPIRQKTQFMAFDGAFGWFFIGRLIKYLGAFPVSQNPKSFSSAFRTALRALNDGAVLVIFPEGSRQIEDGELLEMKEGAMRIAIAQRSPVLPVTIVGGNRIWPRGWALPKVFRRLRVIYHEPFVPETDDAVAETERLRNAILSGQIH
ncbi:MAG: 1-acyl-sn-glycerol-3-phosphate acyltransferase [Acidobacteria bacterium OLB17]|nr:MAG: 1-acyl-sn-glycerol-3-phosphate acyltransferase [Acidobacteria bacterium OLB17]MCZ2391684.1 1-acyl-sn-glycerol-3-phosphate acyltransferase [Acidobacteriota bacterium]